MSYASVYSAPLMRTKLYVPPLVQGLVSRQRLLERLDEGLLAGHRLILLSAPAGFGKTTLLSHWVRQAGIPIAWLSLDSRDNDPTRFLAYTTAALQDIEQSIGQGLSAFPQSPNLSPPMEIVPALTNDLDRIRYQFALVLDDYHVIHARPVHDVLAFLLDHAPHGMRLVLATRADPPLPLSRLRGRGQLVELRQSDLRFTPGEAETFLCQAVRRGVRPEDAAALASRTEGWIAGLQMAAVSLRERDDLSHFARTFGGRQEHIADYLADEVLDRQPEEVQAFLLRTSILDRMCGPLCDAICEQAGFGESQHTLEQLQAANLFIVPLDDERRWYRYHGLFGDLLRQRLHFSHGSIVADLHRRASEWYEQSGLPEEAIEHALAATDFDRAADLISGIAEATLMRSQIATLLRWVEALPDATVSDRPEVSLFHAAALLLSGAHPETVAHRLQTGRTNGASELVRGGTAILRALLALWQGDASRTLALCQQALAWLPIDSLFLRGIASSTLGIARMFDGQDAHAAAAILQEAAEIGEKAGSAVGVVVSLCNLAELRIAEGRLYEAKTLYDRAVDMAADEQGRQLPIAGMALVGLGELLREWNDLEEAQRHLQAGIERLGPALPIWALDGHLTLARVNQARGDTEAAQRSFETARRLAVDFDVTQLDDWIVDAFSARFSIVLGALDVATRWAEARGLMDQQGKPRVDGEDETSLHYLHQVEHLTLAQLLLAQGQPAPALKVLDRLLAGARQIGRIGETIQIQAWRSLALVQRSRTDEAVNVLGEALCLAESQGYVRTFLDCGPGMARLLHQALAQGIAPDYAQRLLAVLGREGWASQTPSHQLAEPLTEREHEVLRLLTTQLTNAEIAEHLYITVNTVRFHLKNIYGRLAVHSRQEAVQRATELGLL